MDNFIMNEEKKYLVAGTFPVVTQEVVIKAGEVLEKDTLISIGADGKAVICSNAEEDYFGVLTSRIDATTGDKMGTVMVTGEFFEEYIKVSEGYKINKIKARNKSIFIK